MQLCADVLPVRCVCAQGFVRNTETGKCVRKEQCCACNQKWATCQQDYVGLACQPSCTNPDPRPICSMVILPTVDYVLT